MSSKITDFDPHEMQGGFPKESVVRVSRHSCRLILGSLVREREVYAGTVVRHSRTGMVYLNDEFGEPRVVHDCEVHDCEVRIG